MIQIARSKINGVEVGHLIRNVYQNNLSHNIICKISGY